MTLDEAIQHCRDVAESQQRLGDSYDYWDGDGEKDKADECFECAEEHRQLMHWLEELKKFREQQPCDDCVSRKQAIKICKDRGHDNSAFQISQLPSVYPRQRTGHWIPVSERLPEIRQNVLCQCRGNIYSILRLNHNSDWECIYPHTTYMQSFVIAWMPLPEPYAER